MAGFRPSQQFDPRRVSAQIGFIQTAIYSLLCLVHLLLAMIVGTPVTLAAILDDSMLDLSDIYGLFLAATHILMATTCAWLISRVVQRSRLCLDFTCTFFVLHWILTVFYTHRLPGFWWTLWMAALGSGTLAASREWCMQRESEPIAVQPDIELEPMR